MENMSASKEDIEAATQGLKLVKTSMCRGYVSRKIAGRIYDYQGK